MSKVIKGGTVVTADRSYAADVKIDKGFIVEIGQNLSGDETLDASGCYVMPHHLGMRGAPHLRPKRAGPRAAVPRRAAPRH